MEADKQEQEILYKAIEHWKQAGNITDDKALELKKSIVLKKTERQLIAQYFFIIALSCTLLAFGAIFIDDKLLEKIKVYFSINNVAIALSTAILSLLWFGYIRKNKNKFSDARYEVYLALGGLSILTSLVYVCKDISTDRSYTVLFLSSTIVLIILSLIFRSKTLWTGALISFAFFFEEFTTQYSTNYLFLGMNYPMRFTALGIIILLIALWQFKSHTIIYTRQITYVWGMILFFTGMWMVSIFGNYNYLDEWIKVRQIQVVLYAIPFGIISLLSLYLGIKYKNDIARDFGFIFLLINLYTRYFEYFWDTINKGIFFTILALTFWLVGKWLNNKKRTETVDK